MDAHENISVDVIKKDNTQIPGTSVSSSSMHAITVGILGNRKERWRILSRAMKNIKSKIHHDKEAPYIDEADGGITSESAEESSYEGLSSPGKVSTKQLTDMTDSEDASTSNKDAVGGVRSVDITSTTDRREAVARNTKLQSGAAAEDDSTAYSEKRHEARTGALPEALKNNLIIILSTIYGITIVIMGLVLPLSEIYVHSDHPYFFEVFYLYLYTVSMVFLVYVYTYLLRKERLFSINFTRNISRSLTRTLSRTSVRSSASEKNSGPGKPLVRYSSTGSSLSMRRRKKIAYNPEVSAHTGSFYLRVGLIGFGIGSMIHSGLTFGHYFEVNHFANHCSDAIQAIKPFALLCFTFVQMYFIFMNSKMCIHKNKTLARFGLMHMSCTNVCVWLRSIVLQTLLVMKVNNRKTANAMVLSTEGVHESRYTSSPDLGSAHVVEEYPGEDQKGFVTELSCNLDAMMGNIVENSSVYLYPCTIEYSLVCACVLYVMWSNIGEGLKPRRAESCSDFAALDSEDESDDDNVNHRMSVDCASSSKGLFLGILLFVIVVVCVISFYVLTSAKGHVTAATLLGHISEEIILVVTFVATVIASYQMREMHFSAQQSIGIEEILTLISISGLSLYSAWSITAALFSLDTIHGRLTIVTNLFMLIQAGAQATFTLVALRASVRNHEQLRSKPGRECVTFLLVCNFALWVINTFETQRLEHNQTQVDFYGNTAWSIFSHISVPLGIYFSHLYLQISLNCKPVNRVEEGLEEKGDTTPNEDLRSPLRRQHIDHTQSLQQHGCV